MARKLFVNLPVRDLKRTVDFYSALGFSFNPNFTDETATCMIIGEDNFAMLLTHEKFSQFTSNPIADAQKVTQVLVALTCDSRADVDAMVETAKASGGRETRAAQDHGFMYSRAFADPDGHIWEPFWMDPAAIPSA